MSTTGNYAAGIASLVKTTAKLDNCINYGAIIAATGYAAWIAIKATAGGGSVW